MGVAGTTSRTLACSGDSVARVDREGDTYLADLPAPLVLCTSPGRRLWLAPPAHLNALASIEQRGRRQQQRRQWVEIGERREDQRTSDAET
jgi:hypothetical protein